MLFKSFSRHHASLAKTLFAASNSHHQHASSFFVTTGQLKRRQSQLVPRTSLGRNSSGAGAGSSQGGADTGNPKAYACLCNSSSYSTLSPLSTLDEDKRKEGANGRLLHTSNTLAYNYAEKQLDSGSDTAPRHTAVAKSRRPRRSSTSIINENFTPLAPKSILSHRRYSTSCAQLPLTPAVPGYARRHGRSGSVAARRGATLDSSAIHASYSKISRPPHLSEETSSIIAPLNPTETVPQDQDLLLSASLAESQPATSPAQSASPLATPATSPASSFTSYSSTLQSEFLSDVETAILADSYDTLIKVFEKHTAAPDFVPEPTSIQHILSFISSKLETASSSFSSSAAVTSLEIYTQSLSRGTPPTPAIYSSIISILLSTATTLNQPTQSFVYSRIASRHPAGSRRKSTSSATPNLLPSVRTVLDQFSSSAKFVKIALDIFSASNSVHTQKYTQDVYLALLQACVDFGHENMLYSIVHAYESKNYELTPEAYQTLIEGYGRYGDLTAVVECYRFYKLNAHRFHDKQEMQIYASLITALFRNNASSSALVFFKKLIDSRASFSSRAEASAFVQALGPVLSAIIKGFAETGDFKTCWTWVQKVDSDPQFPSVEMSTLVQVMSKATDMNKIKFAEKLFDYMASRKDSADLAEFNTSRCDLLALSIRANTPNLVMKLVKESQIRGGVWDIVSLLAVTKYLILIGDAELAIKVFNQQSYRYSQLPNNDQLEAQATEAFSGVLNALIKGSQLNVKTALELSKSVFFGPRSFFDNKGGQTILQTLWDDIPSSSQLNEIRAEFPLIDSYILSLHLVWISACSADNSLGGLSIPYPLFDHLKANFSHFVTSLIQQQQKYSASNPLLSSDFTADVSKALGLLGDSETKWKWQQFCESITSPKPTTVKTTVPQDSVSTSAPEALQWNSARTSAIALAAQSSTTLIKAFEDLEAAVAEHVLIGPEAYLNIIENSATTKSLSIIQSTYKDALVNLPHPSEHVEAWNAWNMIHRAIVQHTATMDFALANAAYLHLLEMGSFPCTQGYAQLIANVPTTRPDCADELAFFHEAKTRGVVLNTRIYNALMNKLAQHDNPQNMSELMALYKDMDVTQTRKDATTFEVIVRACCRNGYEAEAARFFDDMMNTPTLAGPTLAPYNEMLRHYVYTARDRARALQIYDTIVATASLTPSELTYRLLIDAYTTIAPVDIDAADRVLLAVVGAKRVVTTKHYASLIYGRGVGLGNAQAAEDFYNALVSHNRVRPDRHIFQALLESLVVNGEVARTTQILKEMIKYGVDLDSAYFANILMRGWAPVNLEKTVGLFEHAVATGIAEPSTYEALLRAYLYHGDTASASSVLHLLAHKYAASGPALAQLEALVLHHADPQHAAAQTSRDRVLMLFQSLYPNDTPLGGPSSQEMLVKAAVGGPHHARAMAFRSEDESFVRMPAVLPTPTLVDF